MGLREVTLHSNVLTSCQLALCAGFARSPFVMYTLRRTVYAYTDDKLFDINHYEIASNVRMWCGPRFGFFVPFPRHAQGAQETLVSIG